MNTKQIFITIGTLAFTFAFLFLVYTLTNKTVDLTEITTVLPTDRVKWSTEKKHVLVEYTDLQCPACKTFHELFASFESSGSANADIPKKVTFVSRHFPLYQIHENAFTTAYAAEAAGKQGKFFEMQDLIFANQEKLTGTKNTQVFLNEQAKKLNLNMEAFVKDMQASDVQKKVNDDLAQGEKAGVNGTPTFFLDGRKVEFATVQDLVTILKNLQ